jgi:hypothetical protein
MAVVKIVLVVGLLRLVVVWQLGVLEQGITFYGTMLSVCLVVILGRFVKQACQMIRAGRRQGSVVIPGLRLGQWPTQTRYGCRRQGFLGFGGIGKIPVLLLLLQYMRRK